MIKSLWLAAALLAASSFTAQAQAPQDTAEQMVAACHAVPSPQAAADGVKLIPDFGTGYCWGAFTTLQSAATALDERGHPLIAACVPSDTTRVQLVDVFTRYAGSHPELLQKDYFPVALAALRDGYPCPAAHGLFK